ncbi:MAG: prolipoprotein diacylglyceryl transferase [Bacteroidales bacterium]|nr:prolipoprotein diacylglyceryl transferase [Bacteroidales bacterium]
MSITYIIWNVRPQLIDFGNFEIRYYSLLFALGFVAGYIILSRIFKNKGLQPEIIDKLTIYMVISTIIGARLGHCLFYEFDYYSQHILEIFLPWQGTPGKDFRFTGFQGLASHGAAVGILAGIYLFARKTKMSYLWVMDMIVMVTALAGAMIRTGNLMNSEIYGKPTNSNYGFVFTRDLTDLLTDQYDDRIRHISYSKIKNVENKGGYVPVEMNITFARNVNDEQIVKQLGDYVLMDDLSRYNFDSNVKAPENDSINYKFERDIRGFHFTATILGMPRFPSQIYEASCYLLIFFLLLFVYYKYNERLREGFLFGLFLTLVFLSRFLIEFIKENQESFEDSLTLNMGQILSIPFVLIGIGFIIWRWPEKKTA